MTLLNLLFSDPISFAVTAGILIAALTIHEFAHAITADKLGDPTARSLDRVTLNPLAHLDPLGTIALLIAGFGWGKPVPFDPYNLENPVRDSALIALAGPVSNILFAIVIVLVTLGLKLAGIVVPLSIVFPGVLYNVLLAVFNLVPVTPLDGSKVLMALLPRHAAFEYEQFMRQFGQWLLIALIVPWGGSSVIGSLITPVIQLISGLLLTPLV